MDINLGNNNNYKIVNIIIILVSLLLLIYTGIRAATLSFTFDESLSYNRFVSLGFMDIVSYKVPNANNHMINSLFMKYISTFFGNSEFLLRLPSLVSHLIYIIFSYRIIKNVSSPYVALAGFLLLNINPFLLDYFSLARGYAMAVSFTVLSIFCLYKYIENSKFSTLMWSLIFAMLAILSNFCLLIFYVSLIAVLNIYWLSLEGGIKLRNLINKNIPVLITFFFLVIIMFEPIRKLTKAKEFYDGGNTGFWTDTVGSLINSSLYGHRYPEIIPAFAKYFIAISTLSMIIVVVYGLFSKGRKIVIEKNSLLLLLLLLTCFVSVVQHHTLNSLFLINRMALFFIPLFFIPFILLFNELIKIERIKIACFCFLFIVCGVLVFHTITSLNISYTLMWRYDADTKKMLSDLENQVKKGEQSHVKLGVIWLYQPTSNFYRTTNKYVWLEEVGWDNNITPGYDYYFIADSSNSFIKAQKLSVIQHYPISNSYLLK